nr:cytochrome c oxidase subunit 3 [Discoporella cookae]
MKQTVWMINPFHLVQPSPWPLTGSVGAFTLTSGLTLWFHHFKINMMFLGLLLIILTMFQWWRDVCRESTFQGFHTYQTTKGIRIGMILFIVSEVCFFFAFFWAFFHSSMAPTLETGMMWPPKGINPLSPWSVPLLNTVVLLSSGITVTWAHHSILTKTWKETTLSLSLTMMLGIYFTYLQAMEYQEASFSLSDSVYGTTFFVTTGFHGLHVLIGTTFLYVCLVRHMMNHFTQMNHTGFEAAAWYWHFVDVVWLFLSCQ